MILEVMKKMKKMKMKMKMKKKVNLIKKQHHQKIEHIKEHHEDVVFNQNEEILIIKERVILSQIIQIDHDHVQEIEE